MEDHEGFSKTIKGTRWFKNAPGNCLIKSEQPEAIVHERRVDHFRETKGARCTRLSSKGAGFPEFARSGARVSIASRSEDLFSVPADDCSAFGLGLAATMSLRCDSDDVD